MPQEATCRRDADTVVDASNSAERLRVAAIQPQNCIFFIRCDEEPEEQRTPPRPPTTPVAMVSSAASARAQMSDADASRSRRRHAHTRTMPKRARHARHGELREPTASSPRRYRQTASRRSAPPNMCRPKRCYIFTARVAAPYARPSRESGVILSNAQLSLLKMQLTFRPRHTHARYSRRYVLRQMFAPEVACPPFRQLANAASAALHAAPRREAVRYFARRCLAPAC